MKTILVSLLMLIIMSQSAKSQNVGDSAPDFSLTDLSENTVTLSQYKGKVIALFFLGYACPSCIAVGPDIESQIQDIYGANNNFVLLGLDQWDGNKAGVESFKSQTGATFTLLQKASGTAASYKTTYDRLIIVDQEGKISFKGTNLVSSDMDAAISNINSLLTTTDIPKTESAFEIELYPNPVESVLHVKLKAGLSGDVSVVLQNINGQTIQTIGSVASGDNNTYTLDIENVTPGFYFVNVKIGNETKVFKIVKN
jgi:peroxiredoxin